MPFRDLLKYGLTISWIETKLKARIVKAICTAFLL
jgi:hypothetical protein